MWEDGETEGSWFTADHAMTITRYKLESKTHFRIGDIETKMNRNKVKRRGKVEEYDVKRGPRVTLNKK